MPAGRPRKPRALELLDGSPSHKTKKQLSEVLGVDAWGKMFTPEHLMEDAKACVAIIESSMPPELYKKLDSFALAAFGMAWAVHKRASIEVGKPNFQWVVISRTGVPSPSPWIKILNEQARNIAALGGRLGLDPISRQALHSPEQLKQSKFHGLIGPVSTEYT